MVKSGSLDNRIEMFGYQSAAVDIMHRASRMRTDHVLIMTAS